MFPLRPGLETPVCPPWERPERKSLGHERTFVEDTDDLKILRGRLQRLLEQSCAQLRSEDSIDGEGSH